MFAGLNQVIGRISNIVSRFQQPPTPKLPTPERAQLYGASGVGTNTRGFSDYLMQATAGGLDANQALSDYLMKAAASGRRETLMPNQALTQSYVPSQPAVAANSTGIYRPADVGNVPYADLIQEASRHFDVDPVLVSALVRAESGYNPSAVSKAGARGLMQLMPGTAAGLGVADSFDPRQNVYGGVNYLRQQLDRFGDVNLALAAYNAGPGAVQQYGGIPPYEETINYVKRIGQYINEILQANRGG